MAAEGSRIRFVVGPLSGREAVVLRSNPDNAAQWLVRLDDGTEKKVGKAKIAARGSDSLEGKVAEVIGTVDPRDTAGDDDGVRALVAMGFDEESARAAWAASNHDQAIAVETLLGDRSAEGKTVAAGAVLAPALSRASSPLARRPRSRARSSPRVSLSRRR